MTDQAIPHPGVLTDAAVMFRAEGEPPTYNELVGEDLDDDELGQLWLTMTEYQRAAKVALDAITQELGSRLADRDTGLTVGTDWITYKPRRTSRVVDSEGFWEWIKANPDYLEAAFNPNSIRKTGIPSAVLDTFYEVVESPQPMVSSIPVHVLERNKQRKADNE